MKEILDAIDKRLAETHHKLDECQKLREQVASGEQKALLDKAYTKLEARRDKLTLMKDIAEGKAFLIYEDADGQLTIVKPSEKTAKLVAAAQEYGAKLTSCEKQDKLL
jgi:prophage tail gpP-like protein